MGVIYGSSYKPNFYRDFIKVESLNHGYGPDITFSRATNIATFFDSNGFLKNAGPNEPRFDHDPLNLSNRGLLIEESRTNTVFNSSDITITTSWQVFQGTTKSLSGLGLDGQITNLVGEDNSSGTHFLGNYAGNGGTNVASYTSGTTYTSSCYLKKGPGASAPDWIQLSFASIPFGNVYANFNITNGTIGNSSGVASTITNVGNGWFRCTITATAIASATNTTGWVLFFTNNNNNAGYRPVYTGSNTANIFLFGPQLETGAFATSYIPTTNAAGIRNADDAIINNISSFYNQNEGVIYAEGNTQTSLNLPALISIDDGSTTNRIQIRRNQTSNVGFFTIITNGISQDGGIFLTSWTDGTTNTKIAASYGINYQSASQNGSLPIRKEGATILPILNRMILGRSTSGSYISGYIRKIIYYPKRLDINNFYLRDLSR